MHQEPISEGVEGQDRESYTDNQDRQSYSPEELSPSYSEWFKKESEKEAHFFFTLQAFEEILKEYGAKYVLKYLGEEPVYELWREILRGDK